MTACHLCNAEDPSSAFKGSLIEGGFGRFDQALVISTAGPIAHSGMICDDCIGALIEQGTAELAYAPGIFETGHRLTAAAYEALFRFGAEDAHITFHELNGSRLYDGRALGDEGISAIRQMTELMAEDDTWSDESHVELEAPGLHAISVGRQYALCAIALGYGEADPGYRAAARDWSVRRERIDGLIEELREDILGMES